MELRYANRNICVTKEFTFDSSHQLLEYVGDCANLHGHTYKLQITVCGVPDDKGIVIDFKDLKKFVEEMILKPLDHKNLNDVLPFNTTAENMSAWIFDKIYYKLEETLPGIALHSVKLWETPTSFAECRG